MSYHLKLRYDKTKTVKGGNFVVRHYSWTVHVDMQGRREVIDNFQRSDSIRFMIVEKLNANKKVVFYKMKNSRESKDS
jgi:hypothetical protein